jgi:hypothetical protein
MRLLFILILFLNTNFLFAQKDAIIKKRLFQLSIVPGLGTNGMQPGSFANHFSFNLTSGYSASTLFFEISPISNLNTNYTRGLQITGLVNLTGANAFGGLSKKDKELKLKNGFSSFLSGAQISSLANIVVDDAFGAQFTGGINLVKGALIGFQVSAISNIVYKYSFGVQASALFNVSVSSIDGLQISALSNYTQGGLYGLQLGILNQAGETEGKNSYDNTQPTGVQIGLINKAGKMNGFQVGLVNVAKRSQGTQIGLINIYKRGEQQETRDGTAIGLLNFGNFDYASVYANELFGFNYEISTGNQKNSRIKLEARNVVITNALIYSHQAYRNDSWGIGYGLKKMFFNRSSLPGATNSRFLSYGIDLQHINLSKGKITNELSLLTRFKIMAGKRIAPKLFGINWYVSISLNGYWTDSENSIAPDFLSYSNQVGSVLVTYWPGFSLGFLFH